MKEIYSKVKMLKATCTIEYYLKMLMSVFLHF